MEIRTLSGTTWETIYSAFNEAFENYVIPMSFNKETTLKRWDISSVDLDLSYGTFDQGKLVAFVLHISCPEVIYHLLIGVIPSHRGQHLIEKIYEKIEKELPHKRFTLEVIRENKKALGLYEKLGLKPKRELLSLKGILHIPETEFPGDYVIRPLNYSAEMDRLQLSSPAFENAEVCLSQRPEFHECHCLIKDEQLLAYIIFTPLLNSIREMGALTPVDKYLDPLITKMKLNGEDLRIMNIDAESKELLNYLEKRGLELFVTQLEMTKSRE